MLKIAVTRLLSCAVAATLASSVAAAHAATPPASAEHWVGTWATSPMAFPNPKGQFGADAAPTGTTLRQIVHVSLGGPSLRVVFTNEFGVEPLEIDAAAVAHAGAAGEVTGSFPLTFGGKASVVIPAGAMMLSDAVPFSVAPLSDLAVTFFLPAQTITEASRHGFADQTNYTEAGNEVSAARLDDSARKSFAWDFLKGIDVQAGPNSAAIVAFGDSITDGAHSTRDANARWPDVLAARLQGNKATASFSVLNEGIGGNRVLIDGTGPNALARLDRDVLSQAGVKYLIVLESINDIGHGAQPPRSPAETVTSDMLIEGLEQIIARAHLHGIKVIGATLTPYKGAGYARPDGVKIWAAVNDFIRNGGKFDGVVDFAKLTGSPGDPETFAPAFDSGDHLHPGDAGYKAMGGAIDLKLFNK